MEWWRYKPLKEEIEERIVEEMRRAVVEVPPPVIERPRLAAPRPWVAELPEKELPWLPPARVAPPPVSPDLAPEERRLAPSVWAAIPAIEPPEDVPWYMKVTRPIGQALTWYQERVIEPSVTTLIGATQALWPGKQAGEAEFKQEVASQTREHGIFLPWLASEEMGKVYDAQQTPWGVKGFLELAVDPLMYFGLAGLARAGAAKAGVKLLPKLLTPAVRAEQAVAGLAEIPLRPMQKLLSNITIKSPEIASEFHQRVVRNACRVVFADAKAGSDVAKTLRVIRAKELTELTPREQELKHLLTLIEQEAPQIWPRLSNQLAQETPASIAEILARRARGLTRRKTAEAIEQNLVGTRFSRAIVKTVDPYWRTWWTIGGRPFNLIMSRAILMFGMFTPMNVAEWGLRSLLGKCGLGRCSLEEFLHFYKGYSLPSSLTLEGQTGGIWAAIQGAPAVTGASRWAKIKSGVDYLCFGWGRQLQPGIERYAFVQNQAKYMDEALQKAGIDADRQMRDFFKVVDEILPEVDPMVRPLVARHVQHAWERGPQGIHDISAFLAETKVELRQAMEVLGHHPEFSSLAQRHLVKNVETGRIFTEAHAVRDEALKIERQVLASAPDILRVRMSEKLAALPRKDLRTVAQVKDAVDDIIYSDLTYPGHENDLYVDLFQKIDELGGWRAPGAQAEVKKLRDAIAKNLNIYQRYAEGGVNAIAMISKRQGGPGLAARLRVAANEYVLAKVEQKLRLGETVNAFWQAKAAAGVRIDPVEVNLFKMFELPMMVAEFEKWNVMKFAEIERLWTEMLPRTATLRKLKEMRDTVDNANAALKTFSSDMSVLRAELREATEAANVARAQLTRQDFRVFEEMPPMRKMYVAFRNAAPEDRVAFKVGLREQRDALETVIADQSQEIEGLVEYLRTEPIGKVMLEKITKRGVKRQPLVDALWGFGGYRRKWPETLTRQQAEMVLMGRKLRPEFVTKQGRVRWEYILDELLEQLGFKSEDDMIGAIERFVAQKRRFRDLGITVNADQASLRRIKELQNMMDEIDRVILAPTTWPETFGVPAPGYRAPPTGRPMEIPMALPPEKPIPIVEEVVKPKPMADTRLDMELAADKTLAEVMKPKEDSLDLLFTELEKLGRAPILTKEGQQALKSQLDRMATALGNVPPDRMAIYNKAKQESIDKALDLHGKIFINYDNRNTFDQFMQQLMPFWMYECLAEDTEILTREGWKHYEQLAIGEEVLCWNTGLRESVWSPLKDIAVYEYVGELFDLYGFLFTPNHRWIVESKIKRIPREKLGYKLGDWDRIPRTIPHRFGAASCLTPKEAAILGWVITDGYYRLRNGYTSAVIYQSPKKHLAEIEQLIDKARNKPHPTTGVCAIGVPNTIWKPIYELLLERGLNWIVSHLSQEAAEAMWNTMVKAEGCHNQYGTVRFTQKNNGVLSCFQILSILLGKSANISLFSAIKGTYQACVAGSDKHYYGHSIKTQPYKGKVWCPMTEEGTWLARRDGKVIWTGNSRRWPYILRTFAQHPILAEYYFPGAGLVWQNNRGYMRVPGTDFEINPYRGTVLGTLARQAMRDYPPKHIGWRGALEEALEEAGRLGFYLGPVFSMPFAGVQGDFGEALPAPVTTAISAGVAMGMPGAAEIQSSFMPSRFREYYTRQILASKGIHPDEATDEERKRVEKDVAKAQILLEHTAMMRYFPRERQQYYDAVAKKMEEYTGVSVEDQTRLRAFGISLRQLYTLSPKQEAELAQVPGADLWRSLMLPLLPEKQQEIVRRRGQFLRAMERIREDARSQQLVDDNRLRMGTIGGEEWRDRLRQRQIIIAASSEALKKSAAYRDVPVTTEEWERYRTEFNIPVFAEHPLRQALNDYYEVRADHFVDMETGRIDWDRFYAMRERVLQPYPPEIKQAAEQWAARNDTPTQAIYREARKVVRPYFDVADIIKKQHPFGARILEEVQRLEASANLNDQWRAQMLRRANPVVRRLERMIANMRRRMRMTNPEIDRYLSMFWGRVPLSLQTR
ncbi:hypothetical protein KKF45_05170 [Patescibacteria group bacterium]|nr:hypothetical protein [Patescibacteria group bacterium]